VLPSSSKVSDRVLWSFSIILYNAVIWYREIIYRYHHSWFSSSSSSVVFRPVPDGGEIFRTRQGRPWGPPSLSYNGS